MRWDRIRPVGREVQPVADAGERRAVAGVSRRAAGLVFPGDPGVPRSLAPARNNFAPRIGIAWSPPCGGGPLDKILGGPGKTSIRLGYGMFYTAYEGLSAGIMSANPPYGYTYTSAAPPLFASPFTVAATGADAGQRFPLQQVAYGASRAHPNTSVDWSQFEPLVGIPAVDPTRRDAVRGTLDGQLRAAARGRRWRRSATWARPRITCSCLKKPIRPIPASASALARRADHSTSRLRARSSARISAVSSCSAPSPMRAIMRWRRRSITARTAWNCWRAIPTQSRMDQSAGFPEPVNPIDPSLSRGLSSFDMRHNFVASFQYDLPALDAQGSAARSGDRVGRIAGIARFTSGLPVTLLNNNDTSLLGTIPNGINNNGVDTPQWRGASLSLNTNPRGGRAVFDASQFTLAHARHDGQCAAPLLLRTRHGKCRRHAVAQISASTRATSWSFAWKHSTSINHAQFFGATAVEGNVSSGSFGHAVSAMPPRLIQLALRYSF